MIYTYTIELHRRQELDICYAYYCPLLVVSAWHGSSVSDPPTIPLKDKLDMVQKMAARFVTGNYTYETGNMTGILEIS